MHTEKIELWQHQHVFNIDKTAVEKRTLVVVALTSTMMITEIVFGWLTHSMALFADGWHMGTHAFALGISLIAYVLARKFAHDNRFTFGTWRVEILGAFSSAIILAVVGMLMIGTSIERLINPLTIQYGEAILVAILGLVVNLVCVAILGSRGTTPGHHHEHPSEHHPHSEAAPHHHDHEGMDLNLKSAYLHVVADSMTSVLAIAALLGVRYLGLKWLDPFMGIVGAAMILRWSYSLLRETSGILLELRPRMDHLAEDIAGHIEDGDTRISDLHLWNVAQDKYACAISLVAASPSTPEVYKGKLARHSELAHVTIEINRCQDLTQPQRVGERNASQSISNARV